MVTPNSSPSPLSWPIDPVPGIFTLACTCPVFVHVGDYESMSTEARNHDDSPLRNHIVTIIKHEETP